MYVMAVSTISDNDKFWGSLKKAYSQSAQGGQVGPGSGEHRRNQGGEHHRS